MNSALMRVLGPPAYLAAALALAWAAALWAPLASRVQASEVRAIPWIGY